MCLIEFPMFNLTEIRITEKRLGFQYFRTKELNKECVLLVTVLKKYKDKYLVTDTFSYFYIEIDLSRSNVDDLNKKDMLLNKSFMDFEMEGLFETESEIFLNDFVSSDIFNTSLIGITATLTHNTLNTQEFKTEANMLSSLHYSDFDIKTTTLPEILSLKSKLTKKGIENKIKEVKIELLIYHRYEITGIFEGGRFVVYKINNVNYKELCNKIYSTYENLDKFFI